jgi:predicted DNA-binding transcriptional regulator AlpA
LELAAAYVGLSASAFLNAINTGHYPKPLSDGRRRQWDRHALDAAVDRRSKLTAHSEPQETADAIMGAIDAS